MCDIAHTIIPWNSCVTSAIQMECALCVHVTHNGRVVQWSFLSLPRNWARAFAQSLQQYSHRAVCVQGVNSFYSKFSRPSSLLIKVITRLLVSTSVMASLLYLYMPQHPSNERLPRLYFNDLFLKFHQSQDNLSNVLWYTVRAIISKGDYLIKWLQTHPVKFVKCTCSYWYVSIFVITLVFKLSQESKPKQMFCKTNSLYFLATKIGICFNMLSN